MLVRYQIPLDKAIETLFDAIVRMIHRGGRICGITGLRSFSIFTCECFVMPATPESLQLFVSSCQDLKDEKSDSQTFLNRFFQAFGYGDAIVGFGTGGRFASISGGTSLFANDLLIQA
jgi:hypothetical protein